MDTAPVQPSSVQLGRVLIVDDEADVADMLSIGLERLGYATVAVQDPLSALEAIEEDPSAFDTLLTDLHMPLMSGSELIRRAREAAPHLHIILCTGDAKDATAAEARSLGADRVLHKPVKIQSVAEAMPPQFTNFTQTTHNAEQT
jgi:CheY-like chemotaxis protein